MHRYNVVPLTILILFIINFALAAPVLLPEKHQLCVDVVHVPKDVITVLEKRGDRLEEMVKLFENFDKWWAGEPESSSATRPPSSSAPLESGHGSMQADVPPVNAASSTESDRNPESLVSHPPTPSEASSIESASNPDREAMNVDHDAPPQPENTESLIESGHSHTPPTESEVWYTAPSSPVSDSDSDSNRWSTISNAPSAVSLFENLQTADDELKDKAKVSRRINLPALPLVL
jgi:hypothetical protein